MAEVEGFLGPSISSKGRDALPHTWKSVGGTQHDDLYSIREVARRTGLAVSAIRFYSDQGVVVPSAIDHSGRRSYDLRAVVQLEFVRTLRELGVGLDDIRWTLAGATSTSDVLLQHQAILERQERELRARRAVLRVLSRLDDPSAMMRELIAMPDEERERLADDLRTPDGPPRPRLPDEPTVAQLHAWIELTGLLRDERFRAAARDHGEGPGLRRDAREEFIGRLLAAHRTGLTPDSPHVRELAAELVREGTVDHLLENDRLDRYRRLVAVLAGPPADGRIRVEYDLAGFGACRKALATRLISGG
ncbi:MerR family transcriptional regulator [Actinoplanes solisilvae]|uniref:MerR family transcriptional regulator n=1 Tax=Actinoplanes solisilvae TaxID=2486853 RepID=UPI0013E31CD9|nr:MerR family transcriptional regulator [Actinoplanes solisilvae]